jgi:hypothetical protein
MNIQINAPTSSVVQTVNAPRQFRRESPSVDPIQQRHLVNDHLASLAAEAAAERMSRDARQARNGHRVERAGGLHLRAALGRALIGIGTVIAAPPRADDPCADTGSGQPA